MKKNIYIALFMIALLLECCTKRYNPVPVTGSTNYLVVQGVIDAGGDSTKIRLSRTVLLSSAAGSTPVTGAQIFVQGNDNSSVALTGAKGDTTGTYSAAPIKIDNTKQYRLDIKTPDGLEYQSDYVPVKTTPPIDTIMPEIGSNALNITVNAHDPANNTRYYRWDYTETWEFHSMFYSNYYSNGDTVLFRRPSMQVYYCYKTENSTNIVLGSSAKLTQDVISEQVVTTIPQTSEKIEIEYSILLHQYALTSDAYSFWANLKKNSEELGSIFDAQPSQINGNIHCITNPAEPVIGYVSVSTIQTKRIFVFNQSLPSNWVATYPYTCEVDSIPIAAPTGNPPPYNIYYPEDYYYNYLRPGALNPALIPIDLVKTRAGAGHSGSSRECVDCTVRGTTIKPSFWQ